MVRNNLLASARNDLATLFDVGAVGRLTDAELLTRFSDGRGDSASNAAFALIVERHGPMVLGVCRRVLGDEHTAADAFQATFLILVRKARTVRVEDSLGRWLYGVSVRVARRAKSVVVAERSRVQGLDGVDPADETASSDPCWRDEQRTVIDEEVVRLPVRYRSAVVLCYFEGLTQEQAARRLRCPVGTVESRLHRARERLRSRLTRRGLAPTVGGLATLVAATSWAGIPPPLLAATIAVAVHLANGGRLAGVVPASVALLMNPLGRTMLMTKLMMTAGASVTLGVLALVGVVLAQPCQAPAPSRQGEAKSLKEPRVSSSVEGENLRLNIEVPLERINPDTVILRGQGRQVELAVGPRRLRRFEGHTGAVNAVAFSPDAKTILSASGWPWGDRTIRLWDVASGAEIRRFLPATEDPGPGTHGPREVPGEVRGVAFTPDGRQALSGSTGGIIQLWDVATGKEVRRLSGHTGTIYDLAISPDGRRALTGSRDRTVRLWDIASGRSIFVFKAHTGWVRSVAFSPDGRRALTGAGPGDHMMRLWDLDAGRELKSLPQEGIVRSLAFTPDGVHAIAAVNAPAVAIHLWDLDRGVDVSQFKGHQFAVTSLAISPDGRRLLSTSYDGTVRLWDIATGRELSCLTSHTEWVWTVAFSPRGDLAVSGGGGSGGEQNVAPGRDFALRLWDLTVGAEINRNAAQPQR
jgi:RNA polymerase sigma factor (sigma-70 family)